MQIFQTKDDSFSKFYQMMSMIGMMKQWANAAEEMRRRKEFEQYRTGEKISDIYNLMAPDIEEPTGKVTIEEEPVLKKITPNIVTGGMPDISVPEGIPAIASISNLAEMREPERRRKIYEQEAPIRREYAQYKEQKKLHPERFEGPEAVLIDKIEDYFKAQAQRLKAKGDRAGLIELNKRYNQQMDIVKRRYRKTWAHKDMRYNFPELFRGEKQKGADMQKYLYQYIDRNKVVQTRPFNLDKRVADPTPRIRKLIGNKGTLLGITYGAGSGIGAFEQATLKKVQAEGALDAKIQQMIEDTNVKLQGKTPWMSGFDTTNIRELQGRLDAEYGVGRYKAFRNPDDTAGVKPIPYEENGRHFINLMGKKLPVARYDEKSGKYILATEAHKMRKPDIKIETETIVAKKDLPVSKTVQTAYDKLNMKLGIQSDFPLWASPEDRKKIKILAKRKGWSLKKAIEEYIKIQISSPRD